MKAWLEHAACQLQAVEQVFFALCNLRISPKKALKIISFTILFMNKELINITEERGFFKRECGMKKVLHANYPVLRCLNNGEKDALISGWNNILELLEGDICVLSEKIHAHMRKKYRGSFKLVISSYDKSTCIILLNLWVSKQRLEGVHIQNALNLSLMAIKLNKHYSEIIALPSDLTQANINALKDPKAYSYDYTCRGSKLTDSVHLKTTINPKFDSVEYNDYNLLHIKSIHFKRLIESTNCGLMDKTKKRDKEKLIKCGLDFGGVEGEKQLDRNLGSHHMKISFSLVDLILSSLQYWGFHKDGFGFLSEYMDNMKKYSFFMLYSSTRISCMVIIFLSRYVASCYDLVTPSRTCQGFPRLGDYLQPLHLCTFPS
ncbi:hypothetical protein VP01_1803g1 [Puccinia sorghi]|uniref:Uncharacterized protein n=1 Tax=Puccinia sorghi TaxID=27349 RepID=A0A0L6VE61_9BASI|nr:hypothetical protein VP01_1803g1 [Puccinia sorghi]